MTASSETFTNTKEVTPLYSPYQANEQLFRTNQDISDPSDSRLTYSEFLRKSARKPDEWKLPVNYEAAVARELAYRTKLILALLAELPEEELSKAQATVLKAVSAASPQEPTTDISSIEKAA